MRCSSIFFVALLSGLLIDKGLSAATPGAQLPTFTPTIVARYPHDRATYTQGLQYLPGERLLESTGEVGSSEVRISALNTGEVLQRRPLEGVFGEGSTLLGHTIYALTWQDQVAFAFDARTLQPKKRWIYNGEGWGLTHDGQQLIVSDGSSTLTWRDPQTFKVVKQVQVGLQGKPLDKLNELEYVGGFIYANVWFTPQVVQIDSQSGQVRALLDLTSLVKEVERISQAQKRPLGLNDVLNGIAYVPARKTFLLTGKRWPTLFEVRFAGLELAD